MSPARHMFYVQVINKGASPFKKGRKVVNKKCITKEQDGNKWAWSLIVYERKKVPCTLSVGHYLHNIFYWNWVKSTISVDYNNNDDDEINF